VDQAKVKKVVEATGATAVAPDKIYDQPADVFAPCALGAVINDDTLKRLKVSIVAGGANNQLAEERHGDALAAKGVLYAPDYVINGGGLINVYGEIHGWTAERSKKKAGEIYDTLLRVYDLASREKVPSYLAADRLAEGRLRQVGGMRPMWMPG
jgi:leucine dehydrogenase